MSSENRKKQIKQIIQHIFHLEEKQAHSYEGPDALMVDFQEVLDMIKQYKDDHDDAIGEMDLLMKLFPAILRPNLDRLIAEPLEKKHRMMHYVINRLETTGKLLSSLFNEVQSEYRVAMREIGDLIKSLDPKLSIVEEKNADVKVFLKA